MPKEEKPKPAVPENILIQEYNHLVSLYTHAENTLFSIFNFYVTLLTTITGAIIVILQLISDSGNNLFGAILLLLVFIVLIGLITQDALIHKNVDLAHFALALNTLKAYLLKNFPETHNHIFFMWNLHTRVNPLRHKLTIDEKLDQYLWWMLPIGMHQLFVSLMSSFALAAVVLLIVYSLGGMQGMVVNVVIAVILVIVLSFIANCTYSNLKFNQEASRAAITINGQKQEWVDMEKGTKKEK